jgi:hypothetical protein
MTVVGMALLRVGAAVCALAPTLPVLVACRVLQGLGGALVLANVMAEITAIFPREERRRAMAVNASVLAMGQITGLVFGGFLIDRLGWRSLFLVILIIGGLGLLLDLAVLRNRQTTAPSAAMDWWGGVLSILVVGAPFLDRGPLPAHRPGHSGVPAGRPDPARVVRGGGAADDMAAARPPPAPIEGVYLRIDCRGLLLHRCDVRLLSRAFVRAARAGALPVLRRPSHRAPVGGVDGLESAGGPDGGSAQRAHHQHRGPDLHQRRGARNVPAGPEALVLLHGRSADPRGAGGRVVPPAQQQLRARRRAARGPRRRQRSSRPPATSARPSGPRSRRRSSATGWGHRERRKCWPGLPARWRGAPLWTPMSRPRRSPSAWVRRWVWWAP